MTAEELAQEIGISRATLFRLKSQYPEVAPNDFGNVSDWRTFVESHLKQFTPQRRQLRKSLNIDERYDALMRRRGYRPQVTRRGVIYH